ncbi:tRNA guanosine(34) transglycosylase Tgt [Candidatus Fermentibacterales bacterium]|nr:tRNA guanosine(34) transglycosylase Tgt [Candidatus Fermentibacterales bacterium]
MTLPDEAAGPAAFRVVATSGRARAGQLRFATGSVDTPVFMPVGTQGTVKTVRWPDLLQMGYNLILANTYHLYLRPGVEVIEQAGGLRSFTGWPGAILTDSGGFQLFSLSGLRRSSPEGYQFRSHIDGSLHTLTPEQVIELQIRFGSDIMMVLDECLEQPSDRERTSRSVDLTLDWAQRSRDAYSAVGWNRGRLFGIVQGGTFPDMREASARELVRMGFDGYAIGGVSVGEERRETEIAVESCVDILPAGSPRYLMGVGKPEDLVDFVGRGIDMFDCVVPTRNARGAAFFVPGGVLNMRNARFRNDHRPVQESCSCFACRNHTRAYLRHLFLAREWLAPILATLHNLQYFSDLMTRIREAIVAGSYDSWREQWHDARRDFDASAH